MYKNLKAEMVRQDVDIKQIARLLGIKTDTARLKVNGRVPFRMGECNCIATLFSENNSIDYLFKENG